MGNFLFLQSQPNFLSRQALDHASHLNKAVLKLKKMTFYYDCSDQKKSFFLFSVRYSTSADNLIVGKYAQLFSRCFSKSTEVNAVSVTLNYLRVYVCSLIAATCC